MIFKVPSNPNHSMMILPPHQPYYSHCTHQDGPFHITKENSALLGPKKMRPPLVGMPCMG